MSGTVIRVTPDDEAGEIELSVNQNLNNDKNAELALIDASNSSTDDILLKLNCVPKTDPEDSTQIVGSPNEIDVGCSEITLAQPNNEQIGENMIDLYDKSVLENKIITEMETDENQAIVNFMEDTKIIELSRISWTTTVDKQQYTRGVLWSPDGSCLLTAVNLDGMHVIEIPKELHHQKDSINDDRPLDNLTTAVHIAECGTVYDYAWYPFMNSFVPETCCWLASRQHEPIHLWDAFTGERRCTYRGYDAVDEIESAISVAFSVDGEKVIGGYKKTIKIFQTSIPGREYTEIKTKTPISAFTIHPSYPDILIGGSWNSTIALYDLRVANLGALSILRSHKGGITYLKADQNETFFSGARKDNQIYQWDLRNYDKPVLGFTRNVTTNQRIYFDLNDCGQLATGGTDGIVRVWNIDDNLKEFSYPLHHDCCNGLSFHPNLPIVGTSSGHYHFIEDEMNENEETLINNEKIYENSLILWWYGDKSS